MRYYILGIALGLITLSGCEKSPPLVLVTQEEASQAETRGRSDEKNDGPAINIRAPSLTSALTNPFPIQVSFAPGPSGQQPDMASLKLTYKKLWGIDITDRVMDYIEGYEIDVPETDMPTGKHRLEIYIEDAEKNVSTRLIALEIKD